MKLLEGVKAAATYSDCETYRYTLHRDHLIGGSDLSNRKEAVFIMLNPSTATEFEDDPTIRRCQQFALLWGCDRLTVLNLFALRSTDPKALYSHRDPVGPANDIAIDTFTQPSSWPVVVVAAWGAHGVHRNRGLIVSDAVARGGMDLYRLGGTTKGGHPRHPLYLKGETELELHREAAA